MSAGGSVRDQLAQARRRLTEAGVDSPDTDARALLAAAADVHPTQLPILDELCPAAAARYETMLARRESREPLQHITGVAWFRHVRVHVGRGAFVPRPETELMTGWAIDRLREVGSGRTPVAVDLGTGSGAIAAAVVDELGSASVHAAEIDEHAGTWAAANLAGTGVDLRIGDLAEAFADLNDTVDVVACNPPYVPLTAWESVQVEARDHDPDRALFSGADGLDVIRMVTGVAARLLRAGGWVCCEHAESQTDSVVELFTRQGCFDQVRDHYDYNSRPRFVTARRIPGPAESCRRC